MLFRVDNKIGIGYKLVGLNLSCESNVFQGNSDGFMNDVESFVLISLARVF